MNPTRNTQSKIILSTEEEIISNTYEADAGEIIYFDHYKNEWLPILGGK